MSAQSLLQGKKTDAIALILFSIFISLNFYINLSNEPKVNFTDLRNRIVGARLLKQDTTVYFYKWNSSQPISLYDPYDKCNINNNMITSPPSVLLLMQPLTGMDYLTVLKASIVLHYVFFLLIILPIYFLFRQSPAKNLVLLVGCLLLLSDHWRDSVFRGQSHFIFPAILSITLWLSSAQIRYRFLYIGLLMAFLIWTRPNALLIVPFIFLCRQISARQFAMGLVSGLLLFGIITLLAGDTKYWIEFYQTCKLWITNNTSGLVMSGCNTMETVEGKIVSLGFGPERLRWQTEITDIYHLTKATLHITIKPIYLTILFVLAYVGGLLFFYKKRLQNFSHALFAGILLYWFAEMTTPVLKMSYYYVELFVVVLFFAGKHNELLLREKLLFLASFLFTFLHFIPMNLTLAELCTITCLLSYVKRNAGVTPTADN